MGRPTVLQKAAAFFGAKYLAPVVAAILALTLQANAPEAHAGSATLSWSAPTANSDGSALTDLAGYKVYVGTASGSYQPGIDVGKVTSYSLSTLADGSTYYFAVSAYNSARTEGPRSGEVSKSMPATAYTVTASAGSGGSITAVGNTKTSSATNGSSTITSVTVAAGASQSFSIAAAAGYKIAAVTVDGASIGTPASYTFTSVNANHTIAATFTATTATGGTTGGTTTGTTVFAVNSGGSQYSDTTGTSYMSDTRYTGGTVRTNTATITGTADQRLYQSERSGNFSYTIPVANGSYALTLKFTETYWTAAGQRVFNVAVNGSTVLSNLDLFAKAGRNAAYDVTIPVNVTTGAITVNFTSVKDYAKVCAIAVKPATTTTTTPPATTAPVYAINASGPSYQSSTGILYAADTRFTGGIASGATTAAITGTTDQTIYQSNRRGNFSYNLPVTNGNYAVRLKFAEAYWGTAGSRIFDVAINGTTVISNLDVYAKVGKNAAYDVEIPVSVSNGALNIAFTTKVDNAFVSAILVTAK